MRQATPPKIERIVFEVVIRRQLRAKRIQSISCSTDGGYEVAVCGANKFEMEVIDLDSTDLSVDLCWLCLHNDKILMGEDFGNAWSNLSYRRRR